MKYPISLGKKMGMSPSGPMSASIDKPHDEVYYPSLHLEWDKPYHLPEEGTMVVKFKKSSETTSKHGEKEHQSVSLEIVSIESVDGEEAPEVSEPGDRIDALRKQVEELAEGY